MNKNILIEEQDEYYRLIDQKELDEIEKSALEFDGFTGIRVVGEIVTKQSIIGLIDEMMQIAHYGDSDYTEEQRVALTELKQKIEAL